MTARLEPQQQPQQQPQQLTADDLKQFQAALDAMRDSKQAYDNLCRRLARSYQIGLGYDIDPNTGKIEPLQAFAQRR